MTPAKSIKDIDRDTLCAWADAGIISHARYVEEVERRKKEAKKGGDK